MTEFTVFNKDILAWALDRAGLSTHDLKQPKDTVDAWITGKRKPTVNEAKELADFLAVPLGYFCLDNPPEESYEITDLRTKDESRLVRLSPGLRKTIEHAMDCRSFLSDYFKKNDHALFAHKGKLNVSMSPEKAAAVLESLIGELKFPQSTREALSELQKRIESLGVLVQIGSFKGSDCRLDGEEFSGFALYDEFAPLITINKSGSQEDELFILVREFCYLLLGLTVLSGTNEDVGKVGQFCNAVTSQYLMPSELFNRLWKKSAGSHKDTKSIILSVSAEFGFNPFAVLKRAGELHLIEKAPFEALSQKLIASSTDQDRSKQKQILSLNQPSKFERVLMDAAVVSAYDGSISFTQAYRLTLKDAKAMQKRAAELRL